MADLELDLGDVRCLRTSQGEPCGGVMYERRALSPDGQRIEHTVRCSRCGNERRAQTPETAAAALARVQARALGLRPKVQVVTPFGIEV